MNLNQVVQQLKNERDRLDRAISALEGSRAHRGARTGHRKLSAEARARIAAAQRKRWAKFKAAKK